MGHPSVARSLSEVIRKRIDGLNYCRFIEDVIGKRFKRSDNRVSYWKVNCMEDKYPGLWQTWFLQQTVAIGWPPRRYLLEGPTSDRSWKAARAAASRIQVGDHIIVQLSNSRVGRIGTATQIRLKDWNPTVPVDKEHPEGEMGRRIDVRWDLHAGPVSPAAVALLPVGARFKGRTLRSTIVRLNEEVASKVHLALSQEANWTSMHSRFASERAISEYINAFPNLLEDGMRPYPSAKTREHTFSDRRRSDVLLLDRQGNLVIVECKQHSPSEADINQLRHYMKMARKEVLGPKSKTAIRGILVHGGSRKVSGAIMQLAKVRPTIELVRFAVNVDFATSS